MQPGGPVRRSQRGAWGKREQENTNADARIVGRPKIFRFIPFDLRTLCMLACQCQWESPHPRAIAAAHFPSLVYAHSAIAIAIAIGPSAQSSALPVPPSHPSTDPVRLKVRPAA
ncbi:hypothetical protein BCR44DRAFT_1430780 [Catenaria anguillulae PL171]|uniref:Uncharacterized protein n=1 Tax=Catenaria anguillulae PL171 TaxID=765915 RepID=A0A1Y2HTZ4_9FUNG|nr:hypothetical protein BCR44DRAFT_1430780 [Catenaria anguillulae PL171]